MTPSRSLLLRRRQLMNLSVIPTIFCAIGTCVLALDLMAQSGADTTGARQAAATDAEYAAIDLPPALQVLPPDPTAGERPLEAARRSLEKTLRDFVGSAQRNIGKALLAYASDDIRVFREQSFPAVGVEAARLMLSSDNGTVSRELGAIRLSDSGDLCVSYGNYSDVHGNVGERGIYVMIWRIDLNGDWKLALDLQKNVAPTAAH